jgi:hypothetical protein
MRSGRFQPAFWTRLGIRLDAYDIDLAALLAPRTSAIHSVVCASSLQLRSPAMTDARGISRSFRCPAGRSGRRASRPAETSFGSVYQHDYSEVTIVYRFSIIRHNLFMDPRRNPFAPGAGTPPPELAGREPLLERTLVGGTSRFVIWTAAVGTNGQQKPERCRKVY